MIFNDNYCSIEDAWGSLTEPITKLDKKKKKKNKSAICDLYNMNSNYNEVDMLQTVNDSERIVKGRFAKNRQGNRERHKKFITIDATEPEYMPLYEQKKSDDVSLDKQFYNAMEGSQCSRSYMRLPDLESHFNPIVYDDNDDVTNDNDGVQHILESNKMTSDNVEDTEDHDYNEFKHLLEKKQRQNDDSDDDEYEQKPYTDGMYESQNTYDKLSFGDRRIKDRETFTDTYIQSSANSDSSKIYLDIILYILSGIILIFVMEQFVKIGILLQ